MNFLAGRTVSGEKHYKEVVKRVKDTTPSYLLEAGKEASAVDVDIGQYMFSSKYVFESC